MVHCFDLLGDTCRINYNETLLCPEYREYRRLCNKADHHGLSPDERAQAEKLKDATGTVTIAVENITIYSKYLHEEKPTRTTFFTGMQLEKITQAIGDLDVKATRTITVAAFMHGLGEDLPF